MAEDVYTLTDLAQVKVLADPRRLRILEAFGEERTTKQVAELLGEPPTRLYHHVLALERIGLIRRTRTRQNRGTVEKYYRAIAKAFRADSGMFGSAGETTVSRVTSGLLERTAGEMARLVGIRGKGTGK